MKVWAKTDGPVSEGKYLVVRRDGTIPAWPHFVIAAADPSAPAALNAYAKNADIRGLDPEYTDSIRELAIDFGRYAERHRLKAEEGQHKAADPDQGPHRIDNPAVIEMMRGNGDLTAYRPHQIEAQGSEPGGAQWRPHAELLAMLDGLLATYVKGERLPDVVDMSALSEAAECIRALTRPDPSLGSREPIPMVLLCPKCGVQHVDEAEVFTSEMLADGQPEPWDNPPHRSHLCRACGCIWRPADVATVGVKAIATTGKADNFKPSPPSLGMEGVRIADLQLVLDFALNRLGAMEPGDSRAVSNEYVAMACIAAEQPDLAESRTILRQALASISTPSGEVGT